MRLKIDENLPIEAADDLAPATRSQATLVSLILYSRMTTL